ncbi:hypothetical protein GC197_08200 [bacterium]|nr:hypothetical protein [bacterium]
MSAPLFWRATICLAVLSVIVFQANAYAAEPLSADAIAIEGNFLQPPPEFSPPTEYSIAKTQPTVRFVQIPLPNTPANPWSIWGYGLAHSNGKFYVPLGDHLGIDANSYLYEYDPATHSIRQVADIQSAVKTFKSGDFGFGKIHGRLNEGADGNIYFATYWGQWRNESDRYEGDHVFRFNPKSGQLTDLGMPKYGWGYPSTHFDPKHKLLYAEAHQRKGNSKGDPKNNYVAAQYKDYKDPYHVEFLVYDTEARKVIFQGAHRGLNYGRDFFVDASGNAYWNNGEGSLQKYDPTTNQVTTSKAKMPGAKIRRTVGPDKNGMLYGVTNDTHELFQFDPAKDKIRTLTKTWADSPAMDVTADGKFVYVIPGGHGPSSGTPLIQVNVKDGSQKVIAFLHSPVWQQTKFNLGGTYCLQLTGDGSKALIGFNGKVDSTKKAWGELAVVEIDIPASER